MHRLPANPELEERIISAMLARPEAANTAAASLVPEDFYLDAHVFVFARALELLNESQQLDMVNLRAACAGKPLAIEMLDGVLRRDYSWMNDAALDRAIETLKNIAVLRKVTFACITVLGWVSDPSVDGDPGTWIDKAGAEFSSALAEREHGVRAATIYELMKPIADDCIALEQKKKLPRKYVPAPLREMEKFLDGLKPGQSIVIAGRPGSGKTVLGVQCAEACMDFGARALVYSFEMSKEELAERVLAGRAKVDSKIINRRAFGPGQAQQTFTAMHALAGKPMTIVDATRWTIEKVVRHARREHLRDPIGLIVIDYLQLVKTEQKYDSRERQISEISYECKMMAKELGLPVVTLAQMNREIERSDRAPQLSDLRESGSIEQDADVVLFVTVDQTNRSSAKLYLRKQRGGELGEIEALFEGKYARFRDAQAA
jgi:replicative DNA helicase